MESHARARARIVVSAVVAGLLTVGSIAGSVSGGNTRVIYIGDPDGQSLGILRPTAASEGQRTAFGVLVRNDGKQNVTHVILGIGSDAAGAAVGQPDGPSLPDGSTVVAVYGDGTCTIEQGGVGAMCTLDSLPSRGTLRETIVITTPHATDSTHSFDPWVSVKLDENTSDNGSNTDSFFAQGHLVVDANDGDHFETFQLPTDGPADLGTGFDLLGPTMQGTRVHVPGFLAGAPVGIVETPDTTTCAAGVSCFGALVNANVNNGATVSPYLTWTFRWDVSVLPKGFSASQAGVVHFPDSGRPVLIPNTKKNLCSTTRTVNCVVSSDLTKTYFELVVQTDSNGGIKGYG